MAMPTGHSGRRPQPLRHPALTRTGSISTTVPASAAMAVPAPSGAG